TLQFIEQALYLIPLDPREDDYDPLVNRKITREGAKALADAAEACWQAILKHDYLGFGRAGRESFEAQIVMFPDMVNDAVHALIEQYRDTAIGWKLSGAGGGGYLMLVSQRAIKNAVRVNIRREME